MNIETKKVRAARRRVMITGDVEKKDYGLYTSKIICYSFQHREMGIGSLKLVCK